MTINLKAPELRELKPRIMVCGIGGAGGNAVNNMINSGLVGVDFIVANTDAQALTSSRAERIIQMGLQVTEGLGAGSQPEVGRAAAEEAMEEIRDHLAGSHMVFVTAGMGGGTGTGAAPVIARAARDMGILTVGVVTKPFQFEGTRRMRIAEQGIAELHKAVDTLIIIPNQNLFRVANEKTTFADAFAMADQVLYSGVACITDLMVKEGLINLDFADVRAIMREMGKAMMGTGEASGDKRAVHAAEAAIANPLLDETSMRGARGLLISITGGNDLTLYEVDEAASRIRQEVDEDANIILGATFDSSLEGVVRVSVVATGIDQPIASTSENNAVESRIQEVAQRLRAQSLARQPEPVQPRILHPVHTQAASAPEPVEPQRDWQPAPAQPAYQQPAYQAPAAPALVHDVDIRPIQVRPAPYQAPEAPVAEAEPAPQQYIPPAAQLPVIRPQTMPRIEDFPVPVQAQIRAQQAAAAPEPQPEQRRKSLLEKLSLFGSKPHAEPAPAPRAAPTVQALRPTAPPPRGHSEYARRGSTAAAPAPQQAPLDPHGRSAPAPRPQEDELDIPAFLRRQAN